MKIWTVLLFALGLSCGLGAQPAFEAQVDAKIAMMEQSSEAAEHGPYWVTEINLNARNHPWPVLGLYQTTYRFYFERFTGDAKRDPAPDPRVLVKVVAQHRESDRSDERQFYFKAGQLVGYDRKNSQGLHQHYRTGKFPAEVARAGRQVHGLFGATLNLP